MQRTTDPNSLSLSHVFKATCSEVDESFMAAQTAESLEAIRTRCENHWSLSSVFHSVSTVWAVSLFLYGAALGLVFGQSKGAPLDWPILLVALPILIVLVTASLLLVLKRILYDETSIGHPGEILVALTPLKSHPDICRNLVGLLSESTAGRAYRDAVVAGGRELVFADSRVLYQLRSAEKKAIRDTEDKANCQRVHGLMPA